MAWTDRTDRLVRGLRRDLAGIVDEQTRALTSLWAAGFDEVSTELQDALLELAAAAKDGRITRSQLIKASRLHQALTIMAGQLDAAAQQSGVRISGDVRQIVRAAGEAQEHLITSQLPASRARDLVAGWDRVSEQAVVAIVNRATSRIVAQTKPLGEDTMRVVRRELIRGVAVGENPRRTAARMVARAGRAANFGLTRALNISRTELLDASRLASAASWQANANVLAGWQWHCEFSTRSCIACISKDGQVFPISTRGPDDHPQGRCVGVPVTKSWADLGIHGVDEPASVRQTGREWFAAQSASVQKQMLGPSRYRAWKDGRYPVDDWAVRRENPDWRTSWQVSRAPASAAGASRVA